MFWNSENTALIVIAGRYGFRVDIESGLIRTKDYRNEPSMGFDIERSNWAHVAEAGWRKGALISTSAALYEFRDLDDIMLHVSWRGMPATEDLFGKKVHAPGPSNFYLDGLIGGKWILRAGRILDEDGLVVAVTGKNEVASGGKRGVLGQDKEFIVVDLETGDVAARCTVEEKIIKSVISDNGRWVAVSHKKDESATRPPIPGRLYPKTNFVEVFELSGQSFKTVAKFRRAENPMYLGDTLVMQSDGALTLANPSGDRVSLESELPEHCMIVYKGETKFDSLKPAKSENHNPFFFQANRPFVPVIPLK